MQWITTTLQPPVSDPSDSNTLDASSLAYHDDSLVCAY